MKKFSIALLFIVGALTGYSQNTWTGLTGPFGGKISAIQNDGTTLFAMAPDQNAIYRSTDDGANWTRITPATLTVMAMWVETNKVYAIESTNSITYFLNVTTDGGVTWERKNTTASVFKGRNLFKAATGEMIAWYDYENAYISLDNGVTWTSFYTRTGNEQIFSVVVNSTGDLFLSSTLGVFRHLHPAAGQWLPGSFTKVYDPLATSVYNLKVGIDVSNNLYLTEYSYSGSNVTKLLGSSSANNGGTGTWIDIMGTGLSSSSFGIGQWYISTYGVYLGYGSPQKIYKSSGFGGSWTLFTNSPGAASSVTALKFISSADIFASTSQDGVLKSIDTGANWNLTSKGISALDASDIEITSTGRILYLVNNGTGYWYSDDEGVNWSFKQVSSNPLNQIVKSGTTLLAWGTSALHQSSDNGNNWTPISLVGIGSLYGLVTGGTNELFATGYNIIYHSINLGANWSALPITGLPANFYFNNYNSQQSIAIDGTGKLYLSLYNIDTGKWELYSVASTWDSVTKLSVETTVTPYSFFAVGSKVYWASNQKIFFYNGSTWKTLVVPNQKVMPITSIYGPGIGASNYGSYSASVDDGLTWNSVSMPNSGSFIRAVATNASNVSFAAASFSAALKYSNPLASNPATTPPYVNFNWAPLGGPYGGSVSKVFKGSTGNFFSLLGSNLYTTPSMSSPWTRVVDPNFQNNLSDVIVVSSGDITNGNFLAYAAQKLYRSTDEGQHWTQVGASTPFSSYSGYLKLTSSGILWANDGNNVRRSFNQGLTWSTVYSNPGHSGSNNNTFAAESNTIFVTESNTGIKRSTDSGDNWSVVNNGLANPTTTTYNITNDAAAGSAIAWSTTNVYRFNVGTSTWESIRGDLQAANIIGNINGVFSKTSQEYYLRASGLYRTINGGTNWTKVNDIVSVNSLIFSGSEIYIGSNDGFFYSTDNGTTLTQRTDGINELFPFTVRMIGTRLFLGTSNNLSFVSLDKGSTWTKLTPYLSKIFPMPDGSYLAPSNTSFMYKSTDGATWSEFTNDNYFISDISTVDGNTLYGAAYNSLYTKTPSTQWTPLVVTGLPAGYSSLKVAVGATNKFYVTLYNNSNQKQELYEIVSGAATKLNFATNPVTILFQSGKTYVFDSGGTQYTTGATLYSTTDGVTWSSKPVPTGSKFIISHLDYFFILDANGAVWLSRDLGVTWQNVGDNMTQQFQDVFLNPYDGVVYGAVSGNYQRKSSVILPQELTAPTYTQLSPANGTVDLLTSFNLQATFSEIVNPVATKKIKIFDAANPGVPLGTMDVTLATQNGSTFTFNPSAFTPAVTFSYSKTYFVTIDAGAFVDVNVSPNAFAGIEDPITVPYSWQFQTMVDDGQAPVIITKSPADDATGVAYAATLQITFDENIYASPGKTIKLYDASSPGSAVQSFSSTAGVITTGKKVTFTPSISFVNGKNYYVTMDAGAYTDLFGNASAGISTNTGWNFTALYVDVQAPGVVTYSPASNATGVGFSPTLQLTFDEDIQTVIGKKLRIYDSSLPSSPLETIDAQTGVITTGKTISYTLSTVLSGSKTYHVLVESGAIKDLVGNQFVGISSSTVWRFSTIVVDTQAPAIVQLAPVNNETNVPNGTTLSITFDENIKATAGKNLKLYDSSSPSTALETIDVSVGTISGKTITFTIPHALTGAKTYFVLLDNGAISDLSNNAYAGISSATTWKFSTDAVAPTITQLTPANNSTDISFTTTLELRFDETILAVSGKTINLYQGSSTTPLATVDATSGVISGSTVIFTLANQLISSTSYYVLVTSGAFTDISGNPIAGISSAADWTFTAHDGTPPVVTLLEPADDATEVLLTSQLKITFDETISKVSGKKLILYEASQPGTPLKTFDISTGVLTGKTLSFDPGNSLAYNKSYFVLLESGSVTDALVNQFSGITSNTQWQFSTETDVQKPVITYTDGGTITKGGGTYLVAVAITDNKKVSGGKVYYRAISSETTGTFTSAALALNTSTTKYEFSIPETAFDKYGIEFYLEGSDVAGNSSRSPADANALHYTYVKYTAASAPPLSGLAFGGTLVSYRIISVPYNLADNKVTTIFAELGGTNRSKWRLLTYFNDTKWNDYPADFTTIERGVGYWINIKDVTEIFIEGASTEGINKGALFSKTFNPGWNQIGNPYPVAISWNSIKALPAASSLGVLKTYKDGFQNGDILQPLEGGFVFNSGASVTISIPLPADAGGRQGSVETRLDNPDWTLDLNMKQGDVTYELAGVGMNPKAKPGFDSFDDLNPPHFVDFAEIQFSHPQEKIQKFSRDVVPTENSFTWEFTVDSNLPDEAELYWDNTGFGANNKEIYLYDVALQKPIDMRGESRYHFDAKISSRFKIYYGEDLNKEVKPESVMLGAAYPNPAKNQTTIPFTLSENGNVYHVSLEIFDSMGKKVATLVQGDFASGFYNAVWDLSGGQIAQGIYHARLAVKKGHEVEIKGRKIAIEK